MLQFEILQYVSQRCFENSTPVCLIEMECLVIFASSCNSIGGYILGISIGSFFDFMMDQFISISISCRLFLFDACFHW